MFVTRTPVQKDDVKQEEVLMSEYVEFCDAETTKKTYEIKVQLLLTLLSTCWIVTAFKGESKRL